MDPVQAGRSASTLARSAQAAARPGATAAAAAAALGEGAAIGAAGEASRAVGKLAARAGAHARTGSGRGSAGASVAADGAELIRNGMPADPRWYQKASVYQAHVRSFADGNGDGIGDFKGLTQRLDHIQELGHDTVWLLPFYKSPLRDGGYDIANYFRINPQYGTMKDFRAFVQEAHRRNIRVVNELVLNHTSDQHAWFTSEVRKLGRLSLADKQKLADTNRTRYVWDFSPKEAGPPKRFEETRVIFQDFEESNWAWNDEAKGWFWHRFYSSQPDLNWDNPKVVKDMYKVVDHWLDEGVDGIRLDAVPYLYERSGFDGENLKETHQAIKALRAHIDDKYADRMLLGEANMPAKETLEYFGDGDEAHALFNFPLMPRLYMGTLFGDKRHVVEGLKLTENIPDNAAWMTFLRNHDEMTLEKVTPAQREAVWKIFREGVPEQGIPADPRAPINLGVRLRLSDLVGQDKNRMMMMNSMLYSQPGTPIMYYGDEIGMATHRGLNDRDGVRIAMQWDDTVNGGFSTADPEKMFLPAIDDARYGASQVNVAMQKGDPESILERTKAMLDARRAHPALQHGKLGIVETDDDGVVAYARSTDDEDVVAVVNLTGERRTSAIDLTAFGNRRAVPIHGSRPLEAMDEAPRSLDLEPYEFQWLKLER